MKSIYKFPLLVVVLFCVVTHAVASSTIQVEVKEGSVIISLQLFYKLFESFDFRKFKLNDGVYFSMAIRELD